MWIRAVWKEADVEEEGVIPSNWLIESHVYWPLKFSLRAMNERQEPDTNLWYMFPLVKVKFSSDIKTECELFNETTTAEMSDDDDDNIPSKRKSKKKIYQGCVSDVNTEDEESGQDNQTNKKGKGYQHPRAVNSKGTKTDKLPTPPRKFITDTLPPSPILGSFPRRASSQSTRSRTPSPYRSRSVSESRYQQRSRSRTRSRSKTRPQSRSSQRTQSPPSRSRSRHRSRPSQESRTRQRLWSRSRSQHSQQSYYSSTQSRPRQRSRSRSFETQRPSTSHATQSRSTNKQMFPIAEGKFQKRVLYLLTDIRDMLKKQAVNPVDQYIEIDVTQIQSLDNLRDIEEDLKDETKHQEMMTKLGRIGGLNVKDNTSKVMHKLFTNEVMSQMNIRGKKGKTGFSSTELFKILIASSMHDRWVCLR